MKLYLAGYSTGKKWLPLKEYGQNYLETYLVAKNWDITKEYLWSKKKWFLDSGAYSAASLGIKIDLQEYIEFIKKNKQYFEVYANLDVIGDEKATDENQKIMEKNGLNPLPTYHIGEPKEAFEKLVHNYDYIGIGGLVPYARQPQKIEKCLDWCFRYIFKNKLKTKFHGRGMTNPKFMKKYPFYSVDSTGWLCGGKFKTLLRFQNGNLVSKSCADIRKERGVDFGKKNYIELNQINVENLYRYVEYITKLQKAKHLDYYNN